MKTLRLTTYLRKANREYEKTKRLIGEEKMKKYKIDYDFILFCLLKEELPFKLVYKRKTYEVYTIEDLERVLLIINY